jgi:hypothetical protein
MVSLRVPLQCTDWQILFMPFSEVSVFIQGYESGVKLKLFCPEAKNSSPVFKFIELWGADLIEWGAILVEVNFSCHDLEWSLNSDQYTGTHSVKTVDHV